MNTGLPSAELVDNRTRIEFDFDRATASSEIMILPDGRILAHHLTPELAQVLQSLEDENCVPPE